MRIDAEALGCPLMIVGLAYGFSQLVAAWLGADDQFGPTIAAVTIFLCMMLRFSLPITVLSFMGALNVWEWPWYGALLFAVPGLAFLAFGFVGDLLSKVFAHREVPNSLATMTEHEPKRKFDAWPMVMAMVGLGAFAYWIYEPAPKAVGAKPQPANPAGQWGKVTVVPDVAEQAPTPVPATPAGKPLDLGSVTEQPEISEAARQAVSGASAAWAGCVKYGIAQLDSPAEPAATIADGAMAGCTRAELNLSDQLYQHMLAQNDPREVRATVEDMMADYRTRLRAVAVRIVLQRHQAARVAPGSGQDVGSLDDAANAAMNAMP